MDIINELSQIEGHDKQKIEVVLAKLFNYIVIHSHQEEIFLQKIGYPDLKKHKEHHLLFS